MPRLDHFDLLAPYYDRLIGFQDSQQLITLADLPTTGYLLDAGGGTGRVAEAMRALADQVVVVDLSEKMLRQAAKKDGLHTTCAQSEALPFPDEHFNRILMVDALHHVYDQQVTAAELWRVVKPGGRIVIEEPDIQNWVVKLVALAEKLSLMRSHFMPAESIAGLFPIHPERTWNIRKGHTAWIVVEKPPR